MVRCEVFALCVDEAEGVYPHPIVGAVPACEPCADKLGEHLVTWAELERGTVLRR